jgi:hypothetical protein
MRKIRKAAIAVALGLAGVSALGAETVSAAPAGVSVTQPLVPWTTFRPANPHGASVTRYYANRSSRFVVVCPAVAVNGAQTGYADNAVVLGALAAATVWPTPQTLRSGSGPRPYRTESTPPLSADRHQPWPVSAQAHASLRR